jgi:hypothetical protein
MGGRVGGVSVLRAPGSHRGLASVTAAYVRKLAIVRIEIIVARPSSERAMLFSHECGWSRGPMYCRRRGIAKLTSGSAQCVASAGR